MIQEMLVSRQHRTTNVATNVATSIAMKARLILIAPLMALVAGAAGCTAKSTSTQSFQPITTAQVASFYGSSEFPALQGQIQVIQTPNSQGHPEFEQAIRTAKTSVEMVMYHLTDKAVMQDLGDAAKRGVDVRVIVDSASMKGAGYKAAFQELTSLGVNARASSAGFSITHQKSMIIDSRYALVTAINLTRSSINSRDFGIVTTDAGVINEMHSVFLTDWDDSQTGASTTPALTDANLVWSPVDSSSRLLALIQSAQTSIIATSENLSDDGVIQALEAAHTRGINVRIIVPQCDMNTNPQFNIPFIKQLMAAGVSARVMPAPSTPEVPYMHSKMIVVDGVTIYVGSINFSHNSLNSARELGIIFADQGTAATITNVFESDWSKAVPAPDQDYSCHGSGLTAPATADNPT